MSKRFAFIAILAAIACCWTACKDDVENTGESVLDEDDKIIVLPDTFDIESMVDSCAAIISQADSFLLGEIETDYGLLRASVLTQMACPVGYHYPEGFCVDSVDSICLFMYYASWTGDGNSPMAINAYMLDRKTFDYSGTYPTDLNIEDYCTRDHSILTNHYIVAASEKLDSIQGNDGKYIPMLRMRVNDDFERYFASIQSFDDQEKFNQLFKGVLIETSFGSSTMLHISDIALGVYYRFSYKKGNKDTIVHDMKAFYANAEVRTVNHLYYQDKKEWVEALQSDSDSYNYIIAPAGVYTRIRIPMAEIANSIDEQLPPEKRPYVNKAAIKVIVDNANTGTTKIKDRDHWLSPTTNMLLIKEGSIERFFKKRELPSDTCALLGVLTQGVDSLGNSIYFYNYDLSVLLTNQLRKTSNDSILNMMLVPVTVGTSTTSSSTTAVTSVRQQQTMSATKIRSAKNGMQLELVYSGF